MRVLALSRLAGYEPRVHSFQLWLHVVSSAVYLGSTSFWSKWTNLWTAEEDRHGAVLHDYARDSQILNNPELERMQFEYLKAGFEPTWDKDPYRVFVYTSLQERATQVSHANTGKLASAYEPKIGTVLSNVAKEEARHYAFYREIFKAVLERDPNRGLESAALVMPAIAMLEVWRGVGFWTLLFLHERSDACGRPLPRLDAFACFSRPRSARARWYRHRAPDSSGRRSSPLPGHRARRVRC